MEAQVSQCRTFLALCSVLALAACSSSADPTAPAPVIISITPASGASGVSPTAPIAVTFSHPMQAGMEMNVALHEGSVTGAAVTGSATWSTDRRTLTFTPATPLASATTYVLHLAPTLVATTGQRVDHGGCTALGGQRVTSTMMGNGMMGGSATGPGMMGDGWRMADGAHGMIFMFTTA